MTQSILMGVLQRVLTGQLQSYTTLEINGDDTESNVLQLKVKALIMDIIHMIEVPYYP